MIETRKIVFHQETIFGEMDSLAEKPSIRVAASAVVSNPFAGRFVQDLSALFDLGGSLGERLAGKLTELVGAPVVSYGKAAIVGVNGEFEHGGALLHPKLGQPMRAAIGGGKAVIPSNVKVAPAGTPIDVPLGHKDESWSFDHFDTITIVLPDSPRPDEIVMIIAMAAGGRVHPRCGKGPITC